METDKNVLLVLPAINFNDDEYEYTRNSLEESGVGVKVCSSQSGSCSSMKGVNADVDFAFSGITVENYDAVVLIGGAGVDVFFNDEEVSELVHKFSDTGRYVGAISWAPVILAKAGLLQGKKATIWEGAQAEIANGGGTYTTDKITVDGNIITASTSDSAKEFGQTIADLIKGNAA